MISFKSMPLPFVLISSGIAASATEPCLKYEPDTVELVGLVKRQVFAGPPNYESIKHGDKAESYWVLHLSKPICVVPPSPNPDEYNSPESDVKSIQLNQVDYKRFRHLLGHKIRAKGRLTHAVTGHHYTPVMLEVISIEPAT